MIFEILLIMSHTLLYPYVVHAIQSYSNTPPTETFIDCPEFEISDPRDSLTKKEYIEDVLTNSCEHRDCSDIEPRTFDIFTNIARNYIRHCYQAGGNTEHCIVPK